MKSKITYYDVDGYRYVDIDSYERLSGDLKTLHKQNERLKVALKFYSIENDWDFYCACCADGSTKLEKDHGELARSVLKECEEMEGV